MKEILKLEEYGKVTAGDDLVDMGQYPRINPCIYIYIFMWYIYLHLAVFSKYIM